MTVPVAAEAPGVYSSIEELDSAIDSLKTVMTEAASRMEFEEAASIRDRIRELEKQRFQLLNLL